MRGGAGCTGVAALEHDLVGARQPAQAALGDQALVDRAEPALERRPDRRAERDRLAVHRPAGGDHEVGEGDQRLRVDRLLGDDEAALARELGALLVACAGARRPARPCRRSSTCVNTGASKRW